MNITYLSRQLRSGSKLFSKSQRFRLPTLDLDIPWINVLTSAVSGLYVFCGLSIECRWWMELTIDRVERPSNPSSTDSRTFMPLKKDHIRILALQPGRADEVLRGELLHCNPFSAAQSPSTAAPTYTAVSYCWGYTDHTCVLSLNGAPFRITPSLDLCLRSLRSEGNAVQMLWIDQICINQENPTEKSEQVAMMDIIYSVAPLVTVWLGPALEHSDAGMSILRYFASAARPSDVAPWRILPSDVAYAGLTDVMSRAWFERTWVVQEAALSKETQIVCGQYSFSWPANDAVRVRRFIRMIKYAAIQPQWRDRGLSTVNMQPLLELLDLQLNRLVNESSASKIRRPPDILDLAYDLRNRQTSDMRDRVFALRGLTKGMLSKPIEVDYCMNVEETYEHLNDLIDYWWRSNEDFEQECPANHHDIPMKQPQFLARRSKSL